MSIDGKIAPANRNGKEFKKFMTPKHSEILHKIRSEVDAILVGVNTVILGNPSLTVRAVEGKNPLRVILDSSARTPSNSNVLNSEAETLIAVSKKASQENIQKLKSRNVDVLETSSNERVDLKELLNELEKRGVKSLLVEGGGEVRWGFFKEKLVDELFVWIMPCVWGGKEAPTLVEGTGFTTLDDAIALKLERTECVDGLLILWYSIRK